MLNIDRHSASFPVSPGDENAPGEIAPHLTPGFVWDKLKSSLPAAAVVFIVASVLLGMVMLFHFALGIPFGDLTRDPAAIFNFSFYYGFVSQTGIFFWAAAAAICLLAGAVFLRIPERRQMAAFFLASGFLSLMLGTDDVFLFHEVVYPYFGVSEKAVFGIYAALILGYLWHFRFILLNTRFPLLAMGFGFFAVSVGMDVIEPAGIDPFLAEDGTKMIGIVCWFVFFATTGFTALSRATQQTWNARLMNPASALENANLAPAHYVPPPSPRFRPSRRVRGVTETSAKFLR